MSRLAVFTGLLAVSLLVPADARAQARDGLTPLADRLTDEAIARDLVRLDGLRQTLDARRAPVVGSAIYTLTKARSWQVVAYTEYTDNDDSGLADYAYQEAHRLLRAYDERRWDEVVGSVPPEATPRGGETLWTTLQGLKRHDWFTCAADLVAQAEVRLVWAANEDRTYGTGETRTHRETAQELTRRAVQAAEGCVPPPPPPPTPPRPAPPEPEVEPEPSRYELPNRVHFGADTTGLSARSRSLLDEVASVLTTHPEVRLALRSHVEALGDLGYHEDLARQRAQAVRAYLVQQGVAVGAISIRAPAPREPLQLGEGGRQGRIRGAAWPELDRARERRVDLLFTTPELVIIRPVTQEDDLQSRRSGG